MTTVNEAFAAVEAARENKKTTRELSAPYDIFFTALTVLIMSYSSLFSVVPVLVFLLMWGSLLLFKGPRILAPTWDMALCLAVPILCIASTVWSTYSSKTLYAGVSYLALLLCVMIAARTVRFDAFIRGLSIGVAMVLAITLMNGNYATDPFSSSYALVGLFGSKNMVGFTAEVGILVALGMGMSTRSWPQRLVLAVVPCAISMLCLYQSRSGTALVSLVAALGMIGLAFLVTRFPERIRSLLLLLVLVIVIMLVIMGGMFQWQELILQGLGKDATLTGRTYLWQEGLKVGMERPWLGHGYAAFWVQGNPLAERYWYEFFIAARTGFHFHNLFVQVLVDLGGIGVALIAFMVLAGVVKTLRAVVWSGMIPELVLMLGLAVMFMGRTLAEVDFFVGPFGLGTFLFYSILPRLAEHRRRLV